VCIVVHTTCCSSHVGGLVTLGQEDQGRLAGAQVSDDDYTTLRRCRCDVSTLFPLEVPYFPSLWTESALGMCLPSVPTMCTPAINPCRSVRSARTAAGPIANGRGGRQQGGGGSMRLQDGGHGGDPLDLLDPSASRHLTRTAAGACYVWKSSTTTSQWTRTVL
jgi:hypothetical protein